MGLICKKIPFYYKKTYITISFISTFACSAFHFIFVQFLFICQMDFEHILDDLYLQLNEYRLHPQETANKFGSLKNAYQGNVFKNQYKTREGPAALENLIHDLSQRPSTGKRLKWSYALHMVADEQASILGQKGIFTTQGTSFHKSLPDRVKDYAIVKGRLSEVYEFGGRTPSQILQQLLIDDGLASRKRRNTLLDPIFNYIGIAASYHESHEACTVIILAEDIVSLVAPDANGTYKRRRGVETGKETAIKLTEQVVINSMLGSVLPSMGVANGGSRMGISNVNNPSNLNKEWAGGETVTYNRNTNEQPAQPQINVNSSAVGETVTYQTNVPPSSLTQPQLQQNQYEYYRQQEPTITINRVPTTVPDSHNPTQVEVHQEPKKVEEKSKCTIM